MTLLFKMTLKHTAEMLASVSKCYKVVMCLTEECVRCAPCSMIIVLVAVASMHQRLVDDIANRGTQEPNLSPLRAVVPSMLAQRWQ